MKVTAQTRIAALISCIIYIILFTMFFVQALTTNPLPNAFVHYSLYAIMQLSLLFALFYLMALLKLAGEKKDFFRALYSFIGMNIVNIIVGFIPLSPQAKIMITSLSGMLLSLITLYFFIMLFVVKDPVLAGPIKVYARCLLLMLIFTFGITIIGPDLKPAVYHKIASYTPLAAIIPMLGLAYVIYKSYPLLKQNEDKGHLEVVS